VTVRLEIADRVARITIDRPDRLNAVDDATEVRLNEVWAELEAREDVSCAVITGAGDRAFSVGADLKNVGASGLEYWAQPRPNGFGGIAFRRSLDVPLIARVNGYALGGGMEMVLGCDIVIASETAQFGLPEGRVGRMPLDGGMVLLQRKIPHNLAMGIMLSGRRFSASEMASYGLINEVAAPDKLDETVDKWVEDIVACAPLSLRSIKQVVQRTAHMTPAEAQSSRLPALVSALNSEDAKEGVLAFQQKRMPVWRGR
jgi:enoyl-CoA hydratase/carnithine racemase